MVAYVDNSLQADEFFKDPAVPEYGVQRTINEVNPVIRFHYQDYSKGVGESLESFDLLISQYAGFVSKFYTNFLKLASYQT